MAENQLKMSVRLSEENPRRPSELTSELKTEFDKVRNYFSEYFGVKDPLSLVRELKIKESVVKVGSVPGFRTNAEAQDGCRSIVIYNLYNWGNSLAHECGHAFGRVFLGKTLGRNSVADEAFARLGEVVWEYDGDKPRIKNFLDSVLENSIQERPFGATVKEVYPHSTVNTKLHYFDSAIINYIYFRYGKSILDKTLKLLPPNDSILEDNINFIGFMITMGRSVRNPAADFLRSKRLPKKFPKFEKEFLKTVGANSHEKFMQECLEWYKQT